MNERMIEARRLETYLRRKGWTLDARNFAICAGQRAMSSGSRTRISCPR